MNNQKAWRAGLRHHFRRAAFFFLVIFGLPMAVGTAQEDILYVDDAAFVRQIRPHAIFPHDAHNEAAGIEDCTSCHHLYSDGELMPEEDSIGMECSECHAGKKENPKMNLIRIYHLRCKGCHEQFKAGPVMCGECHRE